MSQIEFPPSTLGTAFACGLLSEQIQRSLAFEQIKDAVCRSCPFFNNKCIPTLPEISPVQRVIAIKNGAPDSYYDDLPTLCALIQGGTLYTHDGHWRANHQDMLI